MQCYLPLDRRVGVVIVKGREEGRREEEEWSSKQ